MMKNWLAAGAVALSLGLTATAAQAQTTTVPGEQVGLATGAPLPEGIYALNTFLYRTPDASPGQSPLDIGVNIPVLVWSTPLVPLGGRIELLVAPPTVFTFGRQRGPNGLGRDTSINVGTFVGGIWAFDLGGNVGVSLLGGVYLNELNGDRGVLTTNAGGFAGIALPQLASNTYRAGIAVSYTGDGYNLTANLTGNFYDSPATFGGNNFFGNRGPFVISDSLNLDLTATKKFGKFEIGAIGYGTVNFDTSFNSLAFNNRGRFALGALIGYDFGPVTAQIYAAHDVVSTARLPNGREALNTEIWGRLIVPLYSPTPVASAAPLMRKY